MVKLALSNHIWVQLSTWEADKYCWTPTVEVLSYHKDFLEKMHGENVRLMFLCGGDLVETFVIPNLWKDEHVTLRKKYHFKN